jgi:hypothetical protein
MPQDPDKHPSHVAYTEGIRYGKENPLSERFQAREYAKKMDIEDMELFWEGYEIGKEKAGY